jgi:aspartyl-tRNA(Asn)/glutamyl-tRNA(Gln) amidotransferase subunit A
MSVTKFSLVDLLAAFRAKSLSPLDYWTAVEARIEAWEPQIHALYAYDPSDARRAAAEATDRWARGTPRGPLDGIPVTVKELVATKGTPIPQGCAATELIPATEDAPAAARLREAGAILFAKTTVPDLGMLSSGLSSFHKLARNPWRLSENPGGSSAGAGAAGAAAYGPLHIGTDIGGSVRLPAAWCGLVGFKPSFGRIPVDPYYVGRCAGPMTRSVADAALAMTVLARPDSRDAMSLPPAEIDWQNLRIDPKGLRIGLMLDAGCGIVPGPEIVAAVEQAAALFATAGAIVETVEPIMTRAILDGIDVFWRARAWAEISQLSAARRALILPFIHDWAAAGEVTTGVEVAAGFNRTIELRRRAAALFERFDLILSPTSPVISFPADSASPTNDPKLPFEHIAFTLPWNMAEQPAISLPCAMSASGMPIGLQIVTPRFADLRALQLADFYERNQPLRMRWPEPGDHAAVA